MTHQQYIVRASNIYRASSSIKGKTLGGRDLVENEDTYGILIEGQTL
jgi:hypothetical protein